MCAAFCTGTAAVSVASFERRKSRSTAAPPARLRATSFGAARFHPSAARCSCSPASSRTPWHRSGESHLRGWGRRGVVGVTSRRKTKGHYDRRPFPPLWFYGGYHTFPSLYPWHTHAPSISFILSRSSISTRSSHNFFSPY